MVENGNGSVTAVAVHSKQTWLHHQIICSLFRRRTSRSAIVMAPYVPLHTYSSASFQISKKSDYFVVTQGKSDVTQIHSNYADNLFCLLAGPESFAQCGNTFGFAFACQDFPSQSKQAGRQPIALTFRIASWRIRRKTNKVDRGSRKVIGMR